VSRAGDPTSRRQQARGAELRTAASLAGLVRDRGDLEGARDVLTPIVAAFEDHLDTTVGDDACRHGRRARGAQGSVSRWKRLDKRCGTKKNDKTFGDL